MKRIGEFMTRQPWTVQLDDSIAVARRMLAEREIHHLPVLDAGTATGMITDRDLALAGDRIGSIADLVMPAHRVSVDAPLDDVLEQMTTKHWDAVIVTEDEQVVGIFTAADALRILAQLVRQRAA